MQWRGAYGSNSKSCPPNTLPLLINDSGSYSMTFKIPDNKSPWGAVLIGFLWLMWRGLLHVLRIKPYDEEQK